MSKFSKPKIAPDFEEVKASAHSILLRRKVSGVGFNDADYKVVLIVDGKRTYCPYYRKWSSMLNRSYSPKYHDKYPSYKDCSVSSDWLVFSVFKSWMQTKDWYGKALDKDILIQGNKVYSSSTCLFVSYAINALLNTSQAKRGQHPLGVSIDNRRSTFVAKCSVDGKSVHIGNYKTAKDASVAYISFKSKLLKEIANNQVEPLKSALIRYEVTS